jgi:hypothetical protein
LVAEMLGKDFSETRGHVVAQPSSHSGSSAAGTRSRGTPLPSAARLCSRTTATWCCGQVARVAKASDLDHGRIRHSDSRRDRTGAAIRRAERVTGPQACLNESATGSRCASGAVSGSVVPEERCANRTRHYHRLQSPFERRVGSGLFRASTPYPGRLPHLKVPHLISWAREDAAISSIRGGVAE